MSFQRGVSRDSVYKNSLICIGDGDNIGDVIDFYLLSDNLEEASQFSSKVKVTLENIAELAEREIHASLVYVAGDDICFTVSADLNIIEILTSYSYLFLKETGKTMSFGIGSTSVEALISLRKAKVSGKGCVISFGGGQN
ncbi:MULTISPECIES: mCpol domain-containing protein [Nostoc]|uniref:MCpol domain-containing protein n=2 Tax=Nostoc TaxID=1177 RepID=A0ABR8IB77_9NOSO|nr:MULTISPECIES: mCpol domain-containing protein [Nostoc]MBD2564240.1 mCpol domain-containing protein [Nostoc linckia FACHB-391]MBD2648056.1 mCpol domain-containing protein [Nostoc foliaceum FACHB-393]